MNMLGHVNFTMGEIYLISTLWRHKELVNSEYPWFLGKEMKYSSLNTLCRGGGNERPKVVV